MERLCARPGCNAAAVAMYNFDAMARVVWLAPLDGGSGRSAGDLCRKHAERLSPPLHWELRDLRRPRAGADEAPTTAATPMLARAFRAAKAS